MIAVNERELYERIGWSERLSSKGQPAAPVIVFLHTPLCGTCNAARKMLEVAELLLSEVDLLESDVNFTPSLVQQYQIRSVPALFVYPGRSGDTPEILYSMGSVQDILKFIRGVVS